MFHRTPIFLTLISLLLVFACVGCVGPITQIHCDNLTHQAVAALRADDPDALSPLLNDPDKADRLMARFRNRLPNGRIQYARDDFRFPMSTYTRHYLLHGEAQLDDAATQPFPITFVFASHPDDERRAIGIENIYQPRDPKSPLP